MRILVYSCIQANTPVGQVHNLLLRLSSPLKLQLSATDVPAQSTVSVMALELGLWSDVHVARVLMENKKITLAFDATTQEGIHINAVHITINNQCYVLGLDLLPGGTAVDYASQVVALFDHFARIISIFYSIPLDQVLPRLQSNVSCVMTDRAIVNQAAVRIIEHEFKIPKLVHVHCNLHPIDSHFKVQDFSWSI